jgi:hypothetical protein
MTGDALDFPSKSAIVNWYLEWFAQSPVLTVLASLGAAIVFFWLLQKATKFALLLLLLAAALVGGSYLVVGEEATNEKILQTKDAVEKQLEDSGIADEKTKDGKD